MSVGVEIDVQPATPSSTERTTAGRREVVRRKDVIRSSVSAVDGDVVSLHMHECGVLSGAAEFYGRNTYGVGFMLSKV